MLSGERIAAEMMEDMPVFMGKKFEKLMIAYLSAMNREGRMRFDRIGQYWDRGETEIDIIFTSDRDKEIYFGECKLSPKRFNIEAIEVKIRKFLAVGRKYSSWKKVLNLYTPGAENFLYKSVSLSK